MASYDPDYALALLLQAKYNKEESGRNNKSKENAVIPYSSAAVPKPISNSLVDPIWETTDPTPDIHALFLGFNKRFFWGSLDSVEVCWSPRMTSCAGVCSYHNRSGYCSVRLSAPLLKLRPRSDLVETLLHELIHAYLFVTNNDRDRDGHGPVFQSHMHRINKEAGTNITIYHSFHDEVKLYQQHWWRCNGVCQSRRPYYGFVKRSMNRAPGPNDIWWTEHQATCGGTFVKVKEPEGFKSKKKQPDQKAKVAAHPKITGFFGTTNSPSSSKTGIDRNNTLSKNIVGFKDLTNSGHLPNQPSSSVKNIHGFQDVTKGQSSTGAVRKTGFPTPQTGKVKATPGTVGSSNINGFGRGNTHVNRGGMLANRGGGTLVVTGKDQRNVNKEENKESRNNIVPFSGTGFVLGSDPTKGTKSKTERILGKSKLSEPIYIAKQPKLGSIPPAVQPKLEKVLEVPEETKCPVCDLSVPKNNIQSHLENCTNLSDTFDGNDFPIDCADDDCKCPVCNVNISRSNMNSHFEDCTGLSNVFNDSSVLEISDEEDNKVPCPCCEKLFEEIEINKHLDECLNLLLLAEME